VIDPADTRAVISWALEALSHKRPELPSRKHGNPPA
jgi:acetyl-CoA carboxylase carboxyltransferase component